ncbi:MAG: 50S ribosomal protein L9 [Phycisphaeraceae bacterium]|nr:50S ribosomal protein L9 [Phycisphaeraceae bacterium]
MKAVELLLTESVDNLGIVGDVVKVRPGYARNFLLPRGLATTPTQGNINRLQEKRKIVQEEMRRRRAELEQLIEKVAGYELSMTRAANEQGVLFGGVSQHEIAQALRDAGFAVDDRAVRIGEQIKRVDNYTIPIQFASDLRTEIKLAVVSDKPIEEEEEVEGELINEDEAAEKAQKMDKKKKKEEE